MSVTFDTSGFLEGLDTTFKVWKECAKPAAEAGARVLFEEALLRVPVSKSARKRKKKTIQPGALKRSIYMVYSKDQSDDVRAEYHVSWSARRAPHGHLVEFGTSRAPAHPFLRPAFDAKRTEIADAVRSRYIQLASQVTR